MSRIWIVLKSEFLRRVQTKGFILSTLLAPLLIILIAVMPGLVTMLALDSQKTIVVVDESKVLLPRILKASDEQFILEPGIGTISEIRKQVETGRYSGLLVIPAALPQGQGEPVFYSAAGGGLSVQPRLENLLDRVVEEYRLAATNASPEVLEIIKASVSLRMVKLTEEGETTDSTMAYTLIGYVMGLTIYMVMFIYGSLVMQGVMEEKQSRIIEVMVSSVKPFELLMGKVLGIGAMGLLQMLVWGVLTAAGVASAGTILALFLSPDSLNLPTGASQEQVAAAAQMGIPQIEIGVFIWFILFFLLGYLLYASLFAAIGSAVEQQQDAQSLMVPVSMLILVPIIFMGFLVESPNAVASRVLSMVPFFAPILMVVRVAITEVPWYEVTTAFFLLVLTFIGSVWVSSRIYRIGILMYGKKPTFRDLIKWFRYA